MMSSRACKSGEKIRDPSDAMAPRRIQMSSCNSVGLAYTLLRKKPLNLMGVKFCLLFATLTLYRMSFLLCTIHVRSCGTDSDK
jgi:hypothetical protein